MDPKIDEFLNDTRISEVSLKTSRVKVIDN